MLNSSTGVQQGDPLGSVLFALALQRTLLRAAATATGDAAGARVIAYIDDVYLIGPLAWATDTYLQLADEYPRIGLEMRHGKGGVYSPCPIPREQLTAVRHPDETWSFSSTAPRACASSASSPSHRRTATTPSWRPPSHLAPPAGWCYTASPGGTSATPPSSSSAPRLPAAAGTHTVICDAYLARQLAL